MTATQTQPFKNLDCYCPSDCTCRNSFRLTICGCHSYQHDAK